TGIRLESARAWGARGELASVASLCCRAFVAASGEMTMTMETYMESPVGRLLLAGDEAGLTRIEFVKGEKNGNAAELPHLRGAVRQLTAYFAGGLRTFDLPLRPAGTAF